ncbi:MAG: cation-transporting P-type ATPase, partial [Pseudomonadota bacterium]
RSFLVWLLVGAAALSVLVGDAAESVAILIVIAINTAIGFATELRATRSMEALRRMASVRTRIRRDGRIQEVDAEELTLGDVVLLDAGDVVTADLRLATSAAIYADESVLTGESAPVSKNAAPMAAEAPLAERASMAYKGASVTRGSGEGVVVAVGANTELGRINQLAQAAAPLASPLERRLDRLGSRLIWLTVGLAAVTALIGVVQGRGWIEMVETAIALAVAAVPEGLPVVATLCLARGMLRMARKEALLSRLSAVETMGATTLVLTDKTGTLTQNRMTVARYLLDDFDVDLGPEGPPSGVVDDPRLIAALEVGVLCSNATLSDASPDKANGPPQPIGVGDPMELALLFAARLSGREPEAIAAARPEILEHAFDPDLKAMATLNRGEDALSLSVKGAPESVVERCARELSADGPCALTEEARAAWLSRARQAAGRGYRVLALAYKTARGEDDDPYEGLTLVGLACLADPLRLDVPRAIADCHRAGLRVVMLTGDHADTAAEIARQAGIGEGAFSVIEGRALSDFDPEAVGPADRQRILAADVFARVSPEIKLQLARLYQREGEIIAMTGDGVNDAPALRQADIGVAMGRRGSEVAREAADMVLTNDAFPTLVEAMREGRVIFDNIRKFVVYLMSCNLSEVLVVGLAIGLGLPAPLAPLQILFLNLVTDVLPAFALGLSEGDAGVMKRPPRPPEEPIVDARHWTLIAVLGGLITIATLGAFLVAYLSWEKPAEQAVTVAFVALALAQLWNVFNLRAPESEIADNEVTRNPYIWLALAACFGLTALALWWSPLADLLSLPWPGRDGVWLAVAFSLLPLALGQVLLATGAVTRIAEFASSRLALSETASPPSA